MEKVGTTTSLVESLQDLASWPNNRELFKLSKEKKSSFTIEDATLGVKCFGVPGSGKSSGPLKTFAWHYLKAGFGGMFMSFKQEDPEYWINLARKAGRERDLVVISDKNNNNFNFLENELRNSSTGVEGVSSLLAYLGKGIKNKQSSNENPFWDEQLERFLFFAINLLQLAGEKVNSINIKNIIRELPKGYKKDEDDDRSHLYYIQLVETIKNRYEISSRQSLFEFDHFSTLEFFEEGVFNFSPETRSNIFGIIDSLLDLFLRDPLKSLLTSDTTVYPSDTFKGKIFVIDMSVESRGILGKVINTIWKHCFQMACSRRTDFKNGRPVFLISDEDHSFVTPTDVLAQATLRSKRYCSVTACQTISQYLEVFGSGARAQDLVDAILGTGECKIFCRSSDIKTNEYAIKLIGDIDLKGPVIDFNGIISTLFLEIKDSIFSEPFSKGSSNSQKEKTNRRKEKGPLKSEVIATLKGGRIPNKSKVETIVYFPGKFKCLAKKVEFDQCIDEKAPV